MSQGVKNVTRTKNQESLVMNHPPSCKYPGVTSSSEVFARKPSKVKEGQFSEAISTKYVQPRSQGLFPENEVKICQKGGLKMTAKRNQQIRKT